MPSDKTHAASTHAADKAHPDGIVAKDVDTRRAEIVMASRELFEEKGLSATSVTDITSRVGVTRSLFYHYFPNKDAVVSAVLDMYTDEFVEALNYWNANRCAGDIEQALSSLVHLVRTALFEKNDFRRALASKENAALYIELVGRVADHAASYIIDTTVRDYAALHEVRIQHLHETLYVLIVGVISYLRRHPDVDDSVVADVIAQTLHMYRPE